MEVFFKSRRPAHVKCRKKLFRSEEFVNNQSMARSVGRNAALVAVLFSLTVGLAAEEESSELPYRVETLATGLKFPWSLAFLPNGDALVTEKFGELRILRKGALDPAPITGGPNNILKEGDSGLLDVILDPDFEKNRTLFITFNEGTKEKNHLAVFRAKFDGASLSDGKVIFRSSPEKEGPAHSGGRMVFLPDGTFLVTVSDGFTYRDAAQDLGSDLGKVLRLDRDGQVPRDNPFVGKEGARPEIFTYGHRNALGILIDPRNGDIWLHENGPKGGDEINLLKPGLNYGWPKTTFGVDYSGELVSKLQKAPGITDPVVVWTPSIAPSGFTLYLGKQFPHWTGDFFVGALAEKSIRRVKIRNGNWTEQQILLRELDTRIRDVRTGPDGNIYALTDKDNGQVLRLSPR
jgi:aldose sugar dehydrogenase